MRVVILIKGGLVSEIFVRGKVHILRDVVRTSCIFFFLSFLDTLFMYLRSCDHVVIANLVLVDIYIYIYTHLRLSLQFFNLSLYVLFLYSLYAHAYYILYAILYFCFTLRCLDEFCLKCFKNTSCQSLLAINSLLAKFFKSLC